MYTNSSCYTIEDPQMLSALLILRIISSLKTFFCPCATLSKIASVASDKEISSSEACNEIMAYSLILSCCCYTCCIRRKLRRTLNIKHRLKHDEGDDDDDIDGDDEVIFQQHDADRFLHWLRP